jgi:hypothetical protein
MNMNTTYICYREPTLQQMYIVFDGYFFFFILFLLFFFFFLLKKS